MHAVTFVTSIRKSAAQNALFRAAGFIGFTLSWHRGDRADENIVLTVVFFVCVLNVPLTLNQRRRNDNGDNAIWLGVNWSRQNPGKFGQANGAKLKRQLRALSWR